MPPQMEAPRVMMTPPPVTPQQPKNIHINPHFKGAVVTPVQVPLLPVPSQPRPAVGPQRFPVSSSCSFCTMGRAYIEQEIVIQQIRGAGQIEV